MIDRVVTVDIPLWTEEHGLDGLLVATLPGGKNVLEIALERAAAKFGRQHRELAGCLITGYEVEIANRDGIDVLRFRLRIVGRGQYEL